MRTSGDFIEHNASHCAVEVYHVPDVLTVT